MLVPLAAARLNSMMSTAEAVRSRRGTCIASQARSHRTLTSRPSLAHAHT
jgi:hypothetical protein